MKYYETVLVLKEPFENRNRIHKSLEKLVQDSFFKGAVEVLRHADSAPRYRFIAQPHESGTLCVVRSRLPLGLPGEAAKAFHHDESKPFEFKALMCLNRKRGSKLIFDPSSYDDLVESHLERHGIIDAGVFVDDAIKYPLNKGRDKFFLMGAWVTVNANATKEQAYSLMIDGIGIKSVYGFGLVFPETR